MQTKSKLEEVQEIVNKTNLRHIAIIMDGNRRWAKEHFVPTAIGHQKGAQALKNTLKACSSFGIKYLTVYAFSTENWNRKPDEVEFLMDLLAKTIENELDEMNSANVHIKFIGNISKLSNSLRKILENAENTTKNNTGVHLQIAFNYGAKDELTMAMKNIALKVKNNELDIDDITQDTISNELYTAGIPNPDLLIRTGGEVRVSNYLLWQIAYSEILILDKYWPEFDKEELEKAILEFDNRNRRYGK